jgi:hypothetical protein
MVLPKSAPVPINKLQNMQKERILPDFVTLKTKLFEYEGFANLASHYKNFVILSIYEALRFCVFSSIHIFLMRYHLILKV